MKTLSCIDTYETTGWIDGKQICVICPFNCKNKRTKPTLHYHGNRGYDVGDIIYRQSHCTHGLGLGVNLIITIVE